ncbi:MAG: caspase family protein, partial [Enhydrobacter sp.]
MKTIGRRALMGAAGAWTLPSLPARAQGSAAGVALVIGNSKYQWEAQLPNVRRDVPDIAKRFQAMGLKTEVLQDLGRDGMRQAIERFAAAARGANLAAFYFAGHGATWGRDTYLVPVDADLSNPSAVQTLLPATEINSSGASNRLAVLDACRNNPADGWRQLEAQRSAVVVGDGTSTSNRENTLVLFSTAPGRVAIDGPPGQNSPFAAALMRQLDAPSVDLRTLAPKLRRDILIATEGRQVLWDRNTYRAPFEIKGARLRDAPASSGWAGDPSKIIELPNAYAFARNNNFTLPEGLIDPMLRTVAFYDGAEKVASCHYYATHPMSHYGKGHVSSDFVGLARKRRQ